MAEPADPGGPGSLDIRPRAVQHIVVAAAAHADGVRRHGGGIGRLTGRELPRAEVRVAGDHVRATVDVAAAWGASLADVAQGVRRDVTRALGEHSGLIVDGVAVHVAAVVAPEPHQGRVLS